MRARQLYLSDGTAVMAHLCGKCNRVWESDESAERCCRCSFCGEYCDWRGTTTHDECYRKHAAKVHAETMENASLVPGYSGPFLIKDRVYLDAADLLDSVEVEELPEFGFCTNYEAPMLSVDDVLDNVLSNMHDDWEPEAEDDLRAAIEAWNDANKNNGTYWEDRTRKWSKADLIAALPKVLLTGEPQR